MSRKQCKSDFVVGVHYHVLCITDLNQGGMSVTNDIVNVINWLKLNGYNISIPIVYCDSLGIWDGIRIKNGKFAGFYSINETDLGRAVNKAKDCLGLKE